MFLNTLIEYDGIVIDNRKRAWAAHKAAIEEVGFAGPKPDEFWRLYRLNAPDSQRVPLGKTPVVLQYARLRDERAVASDLIALDEPQPHLETSLKLLKQLGACHLVTLCRNRDAINATLDRLNVWMYFDKKQVLPEDLDRRVAAIREIAGEHRSTLMIAGTTSMARAADEAGCRVVGLKNGPTFPKLLRQVGVDVFYDDLDQLTDAITQRDEELQRIGLF